MVHPVQSVVESLYAAGRCPRLHVNSQSEGVVCPDFIREQWRERLIIDLDTSYPLDLSFSEEGISADLSFGGYVTRCSFPWRAIYVVADRATGRGIVLDQNMPESVRQSRQMPTTGPLPAKADLRPVFEPASRSGRPDSIAGDSGDVPAAEMEGQMEGQQGAAIPGRRERPSDSAGQADAEVVKQRRASFRVIDGGS